jgi:Ca2+-binding RTX toxin-like protein
MHKTLLLTALALLALPSAASAATATADTQKRHGTTFGPVTFKAAPGETNDLVVTQANGRLRFHERLQLVEAKGDCEQVNDKTVSCPVTEDIAKVKLGDRGDIAEVEGLVEVFGGKGPDVLKGSQGFDDLNGQGGADELSGKRTGDELNGGPGKDVVGGGGGDDDLIDGEKDGHAAKDSYSGGSDRDTAGSDRGDMIIYASRDKALEINLATDKVPAGDELGDIESAEGGSAGDFLKGDAGENHLVGGGGADRLRSGDGDDVVDGSRGADDLSGDYGDDLLNGGTGADEFNGGAGNDSLIADDNVGESVECGSGPGDLARSTGADTLEGCEIANSDPLYFKVQPKISGGTATFRVACQQLGGCSGSLSLTGPAGENFGSGTFADLPDDPQTFSPVTVDLTGEGVAALAGGVVVTVLHSETGGYKAFMQAGG